MIDAFTHVPNPLARYLLCIIGAILRALDSALWPIVFPSDVFQDAMRLFRFKFVPLVARTQQAQLFPIKCSLSEASLLPVV